MAALNERHAVDLRRADEVVLGQSVDRVRAVDDAAVAPADFDVGMMVFDVGNVRDRIREAHRPVEILELELAPDRLRIVRERPVRRELCAQLLCLGPRERGHAAFAGHALPVAELGHASSLRAYLRATYCSTRSWNSCAMCSPFRVTVFSPSSYTGATGRSPVPGRLMPRLACLLSPGPFTTHPITATVMSSTPTYCLRQSGMRWRMCDWICCASSWN